MIGLREVIQNLSEREGVDAVAVVSGDGLIIDHAARPGLDPDAVAAVVPTLAQAARNVGRAASSGDLSHAVLEFDGPMLVVTALHDDIHLIILAQGGANIGALLFDLHRHRPALAELL